MISINGQINTSSSLYVDLVPTLCSLKNIIKFSNFSTCVVKWHTYAILVQDKNMSTGNIFIFTCNILKFTCPITSFCQFYDVCWHISSSIMDPEGYGIEYYNNIIDKPRSKLSGFFAARILKNFVIRIIYDVAKFMTLLNFSR